MSRPVFFALAALFVASLATAVSGATISIDCGSGTDAGDTYDMATPLAMPTHRCAGHVTETEEFDFYALDVEEGDVLFLYFEDDATLEGHGAQLCIYPVIQNDPEGLKKVLCIVGFRMWTADATGSLKLAVEHSSGTPTYKVTVAKNQQHEQGENLVGHNFVTQSPLPGGVNGALGPDSPNSIDGSWVQLATVATGAETLMAAASRPPIVYYYDLAREPLGQGTCFDEFSKNYCSVPAGAAWALVTSNIGAASSWTLTYAY